MRVRIAFGAWWLGLTLAWMAVAAPWVGGAGVAEPTFWWQLRQQALDVATGNNRNALPVDRVDVHPVPVHIDDRDAERQLLGLEALDQLRRVIKRGGVTRESLL